jgi:hypothetical protein
MDSKRKWALFLGRAKVPCNAGNTANWPSLAKLMTTGPCSRGLRLRTDKVPGSWLVSPLFLQR